MRLLTFSGRTAKEILRDPLNLGFGLGFPLVLLLLLSAIQANIPVSLFEIESLTPGITVFGLSFMTLFTNLAAWLSGIWFDLNLVGGVFKKIAYALPFVHAVELERAVLDGNWTNVFPHLLWVLGYGVAISGIAVLLFLRQMKRQ